MIDSHHLHGDSRSARHRQRSRELILLGHACAIAGQAGQIFRLVANSDWGIDGGIEFKTIGSRLAGNVFR